MKVFISGPMSGYEDFNRAAFMNAEKLLKSCWFDVFNPAWLNAGWPVELDEKKKDKDPYYTAWSKRDLLSIDIHALSLCDAIYMLHGWADSSGAVLEHDYAVKCGMPRLIHVMPVHGTVDIFWTGKAINVHEDTSWDALNEYMLERDKTFRLARSVHDDIYDWLPGEKIPKEGEWIFMYETLRNHEYEPFQ